MTSRQTWVAAALALALGTGASARAAVPEALKTGVKAFREECGACHMAFPPQMLPARSWQAILGDLGHHFGEDASLDDPTRKGITAVLSAYAADSSHGGRLGRFMLRGIEGKTPLRITATPAFDRIHGEVRASAWTDPEVKTPANCQACHRPGRSGEEGGERYERE